MYEVYSLKESDKWNSILSQVPNDVYYSPGYCQVFEENGDGAAYLFVYQNRGITIIYPFLKRKVDMPFVDLAKDYFDIITPYGYGGPICSVKEPAPQILQNFGKEFNQYCIENDIVSEFVRFNPIIENHQLCSSIMDVTFNRNTVYMDLSQSEDEIWNNMSSGHRSKARRASESGLTVEKVNIDKLSLDTFYNMYIKTMGKNNADSYYYFSSEFFYNMSDYLKDMASIFFVKLNREVIAGSYILQYDKYLHYHFNASDSRYLIFRPNNLLNYEIALWGYRCGYKIFHLGGGHDSVEDELFRFKKNFSKGKLLDFYIGKKIHNVKIYNYLCKKWSDHFQVYETDANIKYFPLYRYSDFKVGV